MNTAVKRVAGSIVLVMAAALSTSCGPSKVKPVEANVTGLPESVLAAFRRNQPNSIIRGFRETGEGYRIDYLTPLRKKEWVLYNASGDRLRDSE